MQTRLNKEKITFSEFKNKIEFIQENFDFVVKSKLLPYIFEMLKDLTREEFENGFRKLMKKSRKEWSELYDFGKSPAVADWVNLLSGKKELRVEDVALIEVEKILYEARYAFGSWKPENRTTVKVLSCFKNGLATIHFELFDQWNENKKSVSFFKKDLLEKWLAFHNEKEIEKSNLTIAGNVQQLLPNFKQK